MLPCFGSSFGRNVVARLRPLLVLQPAGLLLVLGGGGDSTFKLNVEDLFFAFFFSIKGIILFITRIGKL